MAGPLAGACPSGGAPAQQVRVVPGSSSLLLRAAQVLVLRVEEVDLGPWGPATRRTQMRPFELRGRIEAVHKGRVATGSVLVTGRQVRPAGGRDQAVPGVWSPVVLEPGSRLADPAPAGFAERLARGAPHVLARGAGEPLATQLVDTYLPNLLGLSGRATRKGPRAIFGDDAAARARAREALLRRAPSAGRAALLAWIEG
jgi:hypothetical protein